MRDTGPSNDTRMRVYARSGGKCELCNNRMTKTSIHHRRPRQMGGSKGQWVNMMENLLAICGTGTTGCHGKVESERENSYTTGRLVRSGDLPWEVPYMDMHGHWWMLYGEDKVPLTLPFSNPSSPA